MSITSGLFRDTTSHSHLTEPRQLHMKDPPVPLTQLGKELTPFPPARAPSLLTAWISVLLSLTRLPAPPTLQTCQLCLPRTPSSGSKRDPCPWASHSGNNLSPSPPWLDQGGEPKRAFYMFSGITQRSWETEVSFY